MANSNNNRVRVDELYAILTNTPSFFSVEFERRTNRADGTAEAGERRRMLCRYGVSRYTTGAISPEQRAEEDFRCGVLTVWDMQAYMRNRANGMSQEDAGRNAYRRIDLVTVRQCSVLPLDDMPPDILRNVHDITNAYRLANMPREPIAAR